MTDDEFAKLDRDKLIDRAEAFYREQIRPLVYPQQKGRMLIIDLESLDYEIDARAAVASERLRERRPGSITLGIKIGYKASISFGGRRLPEEEC